MLTKTEEIELFTAFVESVPADSYLGMMLRPIINTVVESIRNDWACPKHVLDVWESIRQAQLELAAVKASVANIRYDLKSAEEDHARFVARRLNELSDLRCQLRRLAADLATN